jgi:hypothetical protein
MIFCGKIQQPRTKHTKERNELRKDLFHLAMWQTPIMMNHHWIGWYRIQRGCVFQSVICCSHRGFIPYTHPSSSMLFKKGNRFYKKLKGAHGCPIPPKQIWLKWCNQLCNRIWVNWKSNWLLQINNNKREIWKYKSIYLFIYFYLNFFFGGKKGFHFWSWFQVVIMWILFIVDVVYLGI